MASELERECERTPKITASVTYGARKEHPADSDWQPAHSWTVTLHHQRRRLTVDFYGGDLTGEPTAADVLSSLLLDARAGEQTFEDFCDLFGSDPDSRKAERLWQQCHDLVPRLRQFLADSFDRFADKEH